MVLGEESLAGRVAKLEKAVFRKKHVSLGNDAGQIIHKPVESPGHAPRALG